MFRRKRLHLPSLPLPLLRNGTAEDASISTRNHPNSSNLRPFYYSLHLTCIILLILFIGTVYSDFTARDPCDVFSSSIRSTPSSSMPKLFHYQSKEDNLTPDTKTWNAILNISTKMTYPDIVPSVTEWGEVYWSDESCSRLVHDHFPDFSSTHDGYAHTIQRVDSCRYLILLKYGGIYADTDISLHMADIVKLIPDGVGLVESPYRYNENVQNSLMAATIRNHSFWYSVIDVMKERSDSNAVLSSTGPKMLDDAMDHYRETTKGDNDVHTLPCELFQRLPVGQWDTTFLNILGREILSRAIPMKGCGTFGNGICEVTRHSGKASWTTTGSII